MGSAMDLCLQKPVEHGMCAALHNIGFLQLAFMAASSFNTAHSSASHAHSRTPYTNEEVFFESAWRAQVWDQTHAPARAMRAGAVASYHANVFTALKALASVQKERSRTYAEVVDLVRHNVALARSSALVEFRDVHDWQSTKYSQEKLVRLQMCEDIERFSQVMVESSSSAAAMPSPSSSSQGRSSAFARSSARSDSSTKSQVAALQRMRNIWHGRYKEFDYDFTLCEPLISVHSILLGISPCARLLDEHLCLAAKISMKAGNMSFARCSMQKLQMCAASLHDGKGLGEASSWWIREAKVLWREQQVDKAADLMAELDRHLQERGQGVFSILFETDIEL
jgi:hypothetical protein